MAKETPETVVDFSKLDIAAKLQMFKEVTQTDEFKKEKIDLAKELSIEAPKPEPVVDIAVKNAEAIEKKLKEHEKTRSELLELGHKFDTSAKLSEAEQIIYDKIEKNSQAKLSESVTELIKLDADFPSEEILSKMSISTEDKLVVAAGYKEMIVRNSEAVLKIKKELDGATSELKDAKLASPTEEEDKSGEERVSAMMEKLEIELVSDSPSKSDTKKD